MFIKQAWRFNFNSGETVTNIDNTEKNKVSLNPLVTLKQPKQGSVQTRWGKKRKEKKGLNFQSTQRKACEKVSLVGECVRFGVTVQVPLPLDRTNIRDVRADR